MIVATLEVEEKARADLKAVLIELSTTKASQLARKELGDDLSFEGGVVFFSRILRLFHALNETEIEDLSYQRATQITSVAIQARDLFRNIATFSVTKYASNPIAQRDAFIIQARDAYDSMFETVAPALSFLIRKGTDFERLEEQARSTLERIELRAKESQGELEGSLAEARQTVLEVRKIAQEAGVSQHAVHFKGEADLDAASAKPWLVATVTTAGATLVIGGALLLRYLYVDPILTPSQSVQVAIPKIFVFSLLISVTVWCGKTYRAYRHNVIVNRHRQNALATFQAFAEAAGDEATKNAVLLQATQCIFTPQPTGYISAENEGQMPQVLEIVRSLGKAG